MAKKKNKNLDRKNKINLVFDECKRKDFLCGFRKRKLERKKKAQEEINRMLKEEKKRIKQENKESYKKLVVSSRPIPDIEQLLQEEYEDEDVGVKILELSSDTLQKNDIIIGHNRPKQNVNDVVKNVKTKPIIESVPGMGSDEESREKESESEECQKDQKIKTKQNIKQMLKKQATKKIQKSKVFQMKRKLDQVQNKKKAIQKKSRMKIKGDPRKDKTKSKKKVGRKKH